jgi:hypothetical protein
LSAITHAQPSGNVKITHARGRRRRSTEIASPAIDDVVISAETRQEEVAVRGFRAIVHDSIQRLDVIQPSLEPRGLLGFETMYHSSLAAGATVQELPRRIPTVQYLTRRFTPFDVRGDDLHQYHRVAAMLIGSPLV